MFNNTMSNCVKSGIIYEQLIHSTLKNVFINNKKFNTQKTSDLGGCNSICDIQCNFNEENDIKIEIKKAKTPDWMQCSIEYKDGRWKSKNSSKIPSECRKIFDDLLKNKIIFNNQVPPFVLNGLTHSEWKNIKNKTNKWNDSYINIPNDTIRKLYKIKGCSYIQISSYGLYHLNEDVCNFDVPLFDISQEMRIRTKIHSRKNKNGLCVISVTASCKPKKIMDLVKSKYSLDSKNKLPLNLLNRTLNN